MALLDLPNQFIVLILKQAESLRDIHSFGCACRASRDLLRGEESRELWRRFFGALSLRQALSIARLKRILAGGCARPKPATYYYRFQAASRVGMGSGAGTCALDCESIRRAFDRVPQFSQTLALGSLPSAFCQFFTLARGSHKDSLVFIVYSECTRFCLYEVEFRGGKIVAAKASARALEDRGGNTTEDLVEAMAKVYESNRARVETLSMVSVLDLSRNSMRDLCSACGMETVDTCEEAEGLERSGAFVLLVASTSRGQPCASASGRAGRRTARVQNIYQRCEQMKRIQEFLGNRPKTPGQKPSRLERVVVCCEGAKEVKEYRRVVQSMLDHAMVVNPEIVTTAG